MVIIMNKQIIVNDITYELITDYKEAFSEEEFKECWTEYYKRFDYIVGDIAYNKLRMKGFYDEDHKLVKSHNNIKNKDKYLNDNCASDCKYFIVKKVKIDDVI